MRLICLAMCVKREDWAEGWRWSRVVVPISICIFGGSTDVDQSHPFLPHCGTSWTTIPTCHTYSFLLRAQQCTHIILRTILHVATINKIYSTEQRGLWVSLKFPRRQFIVWKCWKYVWIKLIEFKLFPHIYKTFSIRLFKLSNFQLSGDMTMRREKFLQQFWWLYPELELDVALCESKKFFHHFIKFIIEI